MQFRIGQYKILSKRVIWQGVCGLMKSTGIVRRIDDLGRVVLPVELRRTLNLEVRDPVEIFIDGDAIVLRKYDAACLFCGAPHDLLSYRGKQICRSCLRQLREETE